jgi:hypothetical protein
MDKLFSDDLADAAIDEILTRHGHRPPQGADGWRWKAEGPRRVRDLDTVKAWVAGR